MKRASAAASQPAELDTAGYVKHLGFLLQTARERKGLSQERLAARAEMSAYTVRKLEAGVGGRDGEPANPTLGTLLALAVALGVELTDILPPGVRYYTRRR